MSNGDLVDREGCLGVLALICVVGLVAFLALALCLVTLARPIYWPATVGVWALVVAFVALVVWDIRRSA